MSITIDGVTVKVGDTGKYYSTDGNVYSAEVVATVDSDQSKMYVPGNTGVQPRQDKCVKVRITEQNSFLAGTVVSAPKVLAKGSRDDEVDAFELD